MPIDDILREQGAMPTQEQQTQQESPTQTQPGTLNIEVPQFDVSDQQSVLFWLNVLQTVAIIYLLVRG